MLGSKDKVQINFLIVGAAKAGTTSLYYWLKQHPEVFIPDIEEPSYFVHGYSLSDWDKYLSLFEPGRGKRAIGEKSTAYLVAPESSQWIRKMLGDIKIIILLRNPVQRALSLYSWMVMEGYEWISTFEQAFAEEEKRFYDESFRWKNPEYFWDYMYFRSGLYYEQVKRYIDAFGSELVKVYLFEDLVRFPAEVYTDVCNVLEVSTGFRPDFTPKNPSKIPRSIALQYLLRKLQRSSRRLPRGSRFIARQFVSLVMSLNKKVGHKPKIPLEVKKRLREMYRTDITKLGELIQRDLSDWLCWEN